MKAAFPARPHSGNTWTSRSSAPEHVVRPPRASVQPGPRKDPAALCAEPPARLAEVSLQGGQGLIVFGWDIVEVEQGDRVGGGVVFTGDEPGVLRDLDPLLGQVLAHVLAVEDRRRDARVWRAAVTTACPAVERRLVGVVLGAAPMSTEDDEPSESAGEAHHCQCDLGEQGALFKAESLFDAEHRRRGRHGGTEQAGA